MIDSIFRYTFMQNAILSAILASIACGIIGTIIIEKKLVMMSGGIAHTAFGGVGLGYFLHIEPILGALLFSIAASVGIVTIKRNTTTSADILIAMFWSVGMSLGIIFVALTPGYPPDMSSYLFGDILTVSQTDLIVMLFLNIVIIAAVFLCYPVLKSYLFDEEFAKISGINVRYLENLLYVLIALTIVIIIRVVGIILILALLCTPPAIAKQYTHNLTKIIFSSILLGICFCIIGLWISYSFQLASGVCIILFSVLSYIVISILKNMKMHTIKKQSIPS